MTTRLACQLVAAFVLVCASQARAATCTWSGASGNSFHDPASWAGCSGGNGFVPDTPGSADTAIINLPGGQILVDEADVRVGTLIFTDGRLIGSGSIEVTDLQVTDGDFSGPGDHGFVSPLLIGGGSIGAGQMQIEDRQVQLSPGGVLRITQSGQIIGGSMSQPAPVCPGARDAAFLCLAAGSTLILDGPAGNARIHTDTLAQGLLRIGSGRVLDLDSAGVFLLGTGGEMRLEGGSVQGPTAGTLTLTAGRITGSGTIAGAVEMFGGHIDPGTAGAGGSISLAGAFSINGAARLSFDLFDEAGDHDTLLMGADAFIDAVFEVRSSLPSPTATFVLVTVTGALTGSTTPVASNALSPGYRLVRVGSRFELQPQGGFFTCRWNTTSGSFHTAANWNGCNSGIPQSSDAVIIDQAGAVVTVSTPTTIAQLRLAAPTARLSLGSDLLVTTDLQWLTGDIQGSAALRVSAGAIGQVGGVPGARSLGTTLQNQGDLLWLAPFGISLSGPGQVVNDGTIRVAGVPGDRASNTLTGGSMANNGSVLIDAGSNLEIASSYSQGPATSLDLGQDSSVALALVGAMDGNIGSTGTTDLTFTGNGSWTQGSGSEFDIRGSLTTMSQGTANGLMTARELRVTGTSGVLNVMPSASLNVDALAVLDSGSLQMDGSATVADLLADGGVLSSVSGGALTVTRMTITGPPSPAPVSTTVIDGLDLQLLGPSILFGPHALTLTNAATLTVADQLAVGGQLPGESAQLSVQPGSTLLLNGGLTIDQSNLRLDGLLTPSATAALILRGTSSELHLDGGSGTLNLASATLRGEGTVFGNLQNSNGVVSPGDFGTGVLSINGNYTQDSGGRLDLEIDNGIPEGTPLDFDQLAVTGSVSVAGIANIVRVNSANPGPGDTLDLLTYSGVGGSFTTENLPPQFADTHELQLTPTAYRLQPQVGGGPFDCTWTEVSPGNWTNPGSWSCGQVPGPGDTARVLSATADINLNGAQDVAVLEFTGGRIGGGGTLGISDALTWSGGTFEGNNPFTDSINLAATATSTFAAGTTRLLRRIRLTNNGTLNWTGGNLQLQTSDTEFDNQGTLNFAAGSGNVVIDTDGAPNVIFHHLSGAVALNKDGSGDLIFAANLNFLNGAATQINAGRMIVGGDGVDIGQYFVADLATLEFDTPFGQTRSIVAPGSISGDADGILKKAGSGTTEIGAGVYSGTPETRVFAGVLRFNGPQTLTKLQLAGGELFGADESLIVNTGLQWSGGQFGGPASSLLSINGPATLFGANKRILRRQTSFNAAVSWTAGDLVLDSSASVVIGGASTLDVNNPASLAVSAVGGASGFTVTGALNKSGAGPLHFLNVGPGGGGTYTVAQGVLQLSAHVGGGFAGVTINPGGTLALTTPGSTLFGAGTAIAGSGALNIGNGSDVQFSGTLGPLMVVLGDGAALRANTTAAVTLQSLQMNPTSLLTGSANLSIGQLSWNGGNIEGVPGTTLTLTGATSTISGAALRELRERRMIIAGALRAMDSFASRDNGIVQVNAGGLLHYNHAGGLAVYDCGGPCLGAAIEVNGTLLVDGTAPTLVRLDGLPLSVGATGLIEIRDGELALNGGSLTHSGQIDVWTGAELSQSSGSLNLGSGGLTGSGTVTADVIAAAPAYVEPRVPGGASVATLTIDGDFDHVGGGVLRAEVNGVGGGQFDQLVVTGTVNPGPVLPSGSGLSTGQSVPFITHVARSGNYTVLQGPQAGDYTYDNVSVTETRLAKAGAAVCTWDHTVTAATTWETVARWSCGHVPGPADTAILDNPEDMATLTQAVTVGTLDFRAGRISGDFDFQIADNWLWTGGDFAASSTSFRTRLQGGATATFSGGQKTATSRHIDLLDDASWTTGLIELKDGAQLTIGPGVVFTSNPGPAEEAIIGTGLSDGLLVNDGQIVKTGSFVSGSDFHVQYAGIGGVDVQDGSFRIRGPGTYQGMFQVQATALLEFSEASRTFTASSLLTGGGTLQFGNLGAQFGSNSVPGGFTPSGVVLVRNAELVLDSAGVSLPVLRLQHPNARVTGNTSFTVTGTLEWTQGNIAAASPGRQLILAASAVADLSAAQPRLLDTRALVNQGTLNYGGGTLTLANDADLQNQGLLEFSVMADAAIVGAGGGTRELVNDPGATLRKLGPARMAFNAPMQFRNAGSVEVGMGQLNIGSGPTDTGSYAVNCGTCTLGVTGLATREFQGAVGGSGDLLVIDSATANLRGNFTLNRLVLGGLGSVDFDTPGAVVTLPSIFHNGNELRGADNIVVTTGFDWLAGRIAGTAAQSLTTAGLGNLPAGGARVLDGRALINQGNLNWTAGDIDLANSATLTNGAAAQLNLLASANLNLGCFIGCSGLALTNNGDLNKTGAGTVTIAASVSVSNAGLLDLSDGILELGGITTLPGSVIEVTTGQITITAAADLTISAGVVRGNGAIQAGTLFLNAGTVLSPNLGGATPAVGVFTIAGNLDHSAGGTLDIDVNGTAPGQYDLLQVLGNVTPGPVQPLGSGLGAGQSVAFMQHASRTAAYSVLTGAQAANYSFDNSLGVETRLVGVAAAAAFVVDRSDDPVSPLPGDEACTAAANDCTLRGAINNANTAPGADVIEFEIAGTPGQLHVISLNTPLPGIGEDLLIDATTQDGHVANGNGTGALDSVLKVQLDGSIVSLSGPDSEAFHVSLATVQVRGLALVNFEQTLVVDGGLELYGSHVGVAADGTTASAACNIGILVNDGSVALLGSPAVSDRNLIAGCAKGVDIVGTGADVAVHNNLIGTDRQALTSIAGQLIGVRVAGRCTPPATPDRGSMLFSNVAIGQLNAGNVIAGWDVGILIEEPFGLTPGNTPCDLSTTTVSVLENDIGVLPSGVPAIRNRIGIWRRHSGAFTPTGSVRIGAPLNPALDNRIYHSLESGIVASPGVANVDVGVNRYAGNGGLAVDLRPDASAGEENNPTENDGLDADAGPNQLQNFARITAVGGTGSIDLTYNVDSTLVNSNYGSGLRVDFYLNNDGQADAWLGADVYAPGDFPAGKNVSLAGSLQPGAVVLTQVTDSDGNSSELSFVRTGLSVVSSTPEPASIGSNRTIAGQIIAADGEPFFPTGAVTATDGTDSCGPALLTPGAAGVTLFTCTMPTTGPAGARMVAVNYVPDDRAFIGSSTVIPSNVMLAGDATTTSITGISPQPSLPGQALTVNVTVNGTTGAPPGTVNVSAAAPFAADSCVISLAATGPTTSAGSCTITPTVPGVRSFSADYPGFGSYTPSTSALSNHVVQGTVSFDSVVQSLDTTAVGEPFTVTVTVNGNAATPTGTVTVTPLPLGTVQSCALAGSGTSSSCVATLVSPVAVGKVLLVRYGGSADLVYPPIQTFQSHDTTRAATNIAITAHTPEPSTAKEPVTVSFQVTATTAGAVSNFAALNGSVTVTDGVDSCTGPLTPVSSGQSTSGSCQILLRAAGNRQLVATYQGNENFLGAVSPAVPHVVSGSAGADLSIRLRNFRHVLNAGESIEYVIDVVNGGTSVAASSRVQFPLPVQVPNATWVCVPTAPSQCPPAGSGGIDQLTDLVGGGRVSFRLSGVVTGAEGTVVSGTATVTPATGVSDPDLSNNTATDLDVIGLFGDGFEDLDRE